VHDVQLLIKNDKTDPFPLIVENLTKDTLTSD
jgi:hypothetical protein